MQGDPDRYRFDMPLTVTFETHDTTVAEAALVDAGLGDANERAAPLDDVHPIVCLARSPAGLVVGGAVGRTWGECAELQQLWVAPAQRRRGIGAELVGRYEAAAIARGCRNFYLTTFSFQAPALYQALGYRVAFEIRGFPDGIVRFEMVRNVA